MLSSLSRPSFLSRIALFGATIALTFMLRAVHFQIYWIYILNYQRYCCYYFCHLLWHSTAVSNAMHLKRISHFSRRFPPFRYIHISTLLSTVFYSNEKWHWKWLRVLQGLLVEFIVALLNFMREFKFIFFNYCINSLKSTEKRVCKSYVFSKIFFRFYRPLTIAGL